MFAPAFTYLVFSTCRFCCSLSPITFTDIDIVGKRQMKREGVKDGPRKKNGKSTKSNHWYHLLETTDEKGREEREMTGNEWKKKTKSRKGCVEGASPVINYFSVCITGTEN